MRLRSHVTSSSLSVSWRCNDTTKISQKIGSLQGTFLWSLRLNSSSGCSRTALLQVDEAVQNQNITFPLCFLCLHNHKFGCELMEILFFIKRGVRAKNDSELNVLLQLQLHTYIVLRLWLWNVSLTITSLTCSLTVKWFSITNCRLRSGLRYSTGLRYPPLLALMPLHTNLSIRWTWWMLLTQPWESRVYSSSFADNGGR